MEKTSMLGLSKSLENRRNQEREQIEAETQAELTRLVENLKAGLNGELTTTRNDISDQLKQITSLISDLETSTKTKTTTTQTNLNTSLTNLETSVKTKIQGTTTTLNSDLEKIKNASNQHRKAALKSLTWAWLRYTIPALVVCVTILAANWGLMQFQASRLTSMQQQINQANQTLNQLPQGVRFAKDGSGRSFLVYENEPQIFQTQSGEWATELHK